MTTSRVLFALAGRPGFAKLAVVGWLVHCWLVPSGCATVRAEVPGPRFTCESFLETLSGDPEEWLLEASRLLLEELRAAEPGSLRRMIQKGWLWETGELERSSHDALRAGLATVGEAARAILDDAQLKRVETRQSRLLRKLERESSENARQQQEDREAVETSGIHRPRELPPGAQLFYSPNGDSYLLAWPDGALELKELSSEKVLFRNPGAGVVPSSVIFSDDGSRIAGKSLAKNQVLVFSSATGEREFTQNPASRSSIRNFRFSRDSRSLAILTVEEQVGARPGRGGLLGLTVARLGSKSRTWRTAGLGLSSSVGSWQAELLPWEQVGDPIEIAFQNQLGRYVFGTGAADYVFHDRNSQYPILAAKGDRPSLISPDGKYFVVSDEVFPSSYRFTVWGIDRESGVLRCLIKTEVQSDPSNLVFSPDGSSVSVASYRAYSGVELSTWNLPVDQSQARCTSLDEPARKLRLPRAAPLQRIGYAPNGRHLVGGSRSGNVHVWEAGTMDLVAVERAQRGAIDALEFSPEGGHLLTGSGSESPHLWDFELEE